MYVIELFIFMNYNYLEEINLFVSVSVKEIGVVVLSWKDWKKLGYFEI